MTYVTLSVAALALLATGTVPTLRRLPGRPLVATGVVLVLLTAVFDNVIVRAAIVAYDEARILGIRVPYAPIEDFSYALGAAMVVPALWTWLGRKRPEPDRSPSRVDGESNPAGTSGEAS